jgi:hypothetical protein
MRPGVLLLLAGCNQVFGLEQTTYQSADARPEAPGCSGSPFTNPQVVGGAALGNGDFDPSTSEDPTELWFGRGSPQGFEVLVATRATVDGAFDLAGAYGFNSPQHDADPALSADGLVLIFQSERLGPPRVFEARRDALGRPFGSPAQVVELSATDASKGIDLSFDGLTIYYVDNSFELRAIHRESPGAPFGPPSEILAAGVQYPSVSPDGLELFFSRDGVNGIFQRTRPTPEGPFGTQDDPVTLDGGDPDLAPDARTLYYSNNGVLQVTTRTCL